MSSFHPIAKPSGAGKVATGIYCHYIYLSRVEVINTIIYYAVRAVELSYPGRYYAFQQVEQ